VDELIITVTFDPTMSLSRAWAWTGAAICHLHGPYTVDAQVRADGSKLSDLDIPGLGAAGSVMRAVVVTLFGGWLFYGCLAASQDHVTSSNGNPAGLAAAYSGDIGIEEHANVLFAEGFEKSEIPTVGYGEVGGFYDLNGYPKQMHVTDREAVVGSHSLELIHPAGVVSPQCSAGAQVEFPGVRA
jgi:hypothetical protein